MRSVPRCELVEPEVAGCHRLHWDLPPASVLAGQLRQEGGHDRALLDAHELALVERVADAEEDARVFLGLERPLLPNIAPPGRHVAAGDVGLALVMEDPSRPRASRVEKLELDLPHAADEGPVRLGAADQLAAREGATA